MCLMKQYSQFLINLNLNQTNVAFYKLDILIINYFGPFFKVIVNIKMIYLLIDILEVILYLKKSY